MSTATATPAAALTHGDMTCADVEALLAESTAENDVLHDRVRHYEMADAQRQREMEAMNDENMRLRALVNDLRKSLDRIGSEHSAKGTQISLLQDELAAAERDTLPLGTLTHASVTHADTVHLYRAASRITRGPLPPSVVEAVDNSREQIAQAMTTAGQEALDAVIRREVRRRRRRASRAPRRTSTRRNG